MTLTLPTWIGDLPWEEMRAAYDALLKSGQHPKDAARAVAVAVDELVDWTTVIPGVGGVVVEAVDRPFVRMAITVGLRWTSRGRTD